MLDFKIKDVVKLILAGASIIYTASSFGNSVLPNALKPGWNAVTQDNIHRDIIYLTADQRAGRMTATQGDEQAIRWIVEQFRQAGLKPANGDSYLQSFNVIEYKPDTRQTRLILEVDGKAYQWSKPEVITDFHQNVDLSAGVVFAGYGITAPELKYDDYQHIDVKGKFVLIFEHEPQETNPSSIFNGTGNTPYATARIKAINAEQHGAIGLLIAPEPNRKHPSNQERYKRIGGSVNRKVPLPSMVLENDEVQIPIVVLSDQVARKIAAPLELSLLQKKIDQYLQPQSQLVAASNIKLQERVIARKVVETSNVVGLLEGTDPQLKSETVLISAHHDHDGQSGKKIFYGADDNASGTAGVVSLARSISINMAADAGLKLKRSILFSVFSAEERGLLGSYYMAAHPLRPLATTRAMINFDMIGRDEKRTMQTDGLIKIPSSTTNRLNLIGAHYSPEYDKIVREQNNYVGLTLDDRFDSENALNTLFRSDQFPFILSSVPAFWWFTGFHPDYHHTTDTAERIDYPKMQKILRLAYLSAYQFANTNTPPAFVESPKP